MHVDTCSKYLRKGEEKRKIYFTSSKDVAVQIFKDISPDKSSWIGIAEKRNTCPGGTFCELEAGEYFNAIYRSDYEKIREIDEVALGGIEKTFGTISGGDKFYDFLTMLANGANRSLLIDEYMYEYDCKDERIQRFEDNLIALYRFNSAQMRTQTFQSNGY